MAHDLNRRRFLKTTASSLLAATAAGCLDIKPFAGKPPNLLFVFPDQMRGQALDFLNEDPVLTPNLSRFARQSLVLPHTVSNYPICSPYRAMLMTGKYPHSNQVIQNCNSQSAPFNCQLQRSDRCWSDVLKDRGFSLGYIGKWHLDSPYKPYVKCKNNRPDFAWNEFCPPNRRHGFDFWYSYGTYDYHNRPMYWKTAAARNEFHFVDQWGPEHEADLAIKYINNEDASFRDPNKPFALVVSMNPPHMPYKAVPQRYVDMYKQKTIEQLCSRPNIPAPDTRWGKYYRNNIRHYFAMVTGVDDQFGRIIDALEGQNLENDTIVVFTSDHGNCLGIHNQISKNNHYEESMRIPFIIRWPGRIKPRHDDLLLSTPDIYPTLLDLMGLSGDIPSQVQGTSHAGIFRTGKGSRPASQLYIKCPEDKPAWGERGVRNHRYTLIIKKRLNKPKKYILYDNVSDPYQLKNVATEMPDIVKELTAELKTWLKKTNDPWLKNG